jgi:multiple sugar transport system substrate-binding protein
MAVGIRISRRCLLAGIVSLPLCMSGAARADDDVRGQIRFSWWGSTPRYTKTTAIVDLFEKKYPNAKIAKESSDFDSYFDKLGVQAAGHSQPCAITMQSRFFTQFAGSGAFRPLDDLVAQGLISLDGIAPAVVASGRGPDGKLYMIPHGVYGITLLYNKTMFEKYGIPLLPADASWDDLAATAKLAATKLPKGVYPIVLLGGEWDSFYSFVGGQGEQVFSPSGGIGFSKETLTKWFSMWEDLRKSGAAYSADRMAEVVRATVEDGPIATGRAMIDIRAPNQLQLNMDVINKHGSWVLDVQKLPRGPKGVGEVIGTDGIGIGANCNPSDTKVAAAFINFFTHDAEAQRIYASDNGVVAIDQYQLDQANDPQSSYGTRRQIEVLRDAMKSATPQLYPPYSRQFDALLSRTYQSVAFEQLTVAQGVDQFFTEAGRMAAGN